MIWQSLALIPMQAHSQLSTYNPRPIPSFSILHVEIWEWASLGKMQYNCGVIVFMYTGYQCAEILYLAEGRG